MLKVVGSLRMCWSIGRLFKRVGIKYLFLVFLCNIWNFIGRNLKGINSFMFGLLVVKVVKSGSGLFSFLWKN